MGSSNRRLVTRGGQATRVKGGEPGLSLLEQRTVSLERKNSKSSLWRRTGVQASGRPRLSPSADTAKQTETRARHLQTDAHKQRALPVSDHGF